MGYQNLKNMSEFMFKNITCPIQMADFVLMCVRDQSHKDRIERKKIVSHGGKMTIDSIAIYWVFSKLTYQNIKLSVPITPYGILKVIQI